jgi:hypothetical protein
MPTTLKDYTGMKLGALQIGAREPITTFGKKDTFEYDYTWTCCGATGRMRQGSVSSYQAKMMEMCMACKAKAKAGGVELKTVSTAKKPKAEAGHLDVPGWGRCYFVDVRRPKGKEIRGDEDEDEEADGDGAGIVETEAEAD